MAARTLAHMLHPALSDSEAHLGHAHRVCNHGHLAAVQNARV